MEDPEFVILVRKVSPSMHKHIKDIVRVPRFEKVIASKRRSSLIDTFEEFVTVLIKRDFIDPSNKSTWSLLDEVCLEFEGRRFYDVSKQMPMDNDVRVPSITHYSHTNGNATAALDVSLLIVLGCGYSEMQAFPQMKWPQITDCFFVVSILTTINYSGTGFGGVSSPQLDPRGMSM